MVEIERASDIVKQQMLDILPSGAPRIYRDIARAEFIGTDRKRTAIAELITIDGYRATIEVFRYFLVPPSRTLSTQGGGFRLRGDGGW